jgi:antitoxin MazE
MQVAKWGNSLAIRIPAAVAHILNIKEGDDVAIKAGDGKSLILTVSASRDEILARLRAFRGTLPPGWKFDREEANSRGPVIDPVADAAE